MTTTARRRWSREIGSEIDGIAMGSRGPVLLHGYDPPAGGKWIDSVIPGKLAALDRHSGELLWIGPCEVGYGRGFGAAIGDADDVWVLGPSTVGHRIVRMSLSNGELRDAADIASFDEVHVGLDLGLCLAPARVFGVDISALTETWAYAKAGERYHLVDRIGDRALVVFSDLKKKLQGVMRLDAETGEPEGMLVAPRLPVIRQIACTDDVVVLLSSRIGEILPEELRAEFEAQVQREAAGRGGVEDTVSIVALRPDGRPGDAPLWYRIVSTAPLDDGPEVSICADSGKVYLVRGAYLEALDGLTGRRLGEWTVPGLDQQIGWRVVDGGGLLAEETRASLFELPA